MPLRSGSSDSMCSDGGAGGENRDEGGGVVMGGGDAGGEGIGGTVVVVVASASPSPFAPLPSSTAVSRGPPFPQNLSSAAACSG